VIAVVDDDALQRALVCDALAELGFAVEAFAGGEAALARLAAVTPRLVVSDVVMPGLDGLAFRRAYAERFPGRRTPFLFLSSLGSDADQVRGLEAGADDYLVKPVAPALLAAKVRACLRRAEAPPSGVLRGELDTCPFARVVEFCEAQGFSGHVEVVVDGRKEAVAFRGGRLDLPGAQRAAVLDRLFGVQRGFFLVRPGGTGPERAPAEGAAPAEARPAGRRSSIPAGGRWARLETVVAGGARPTVVSVAVLEGRTVFKRSSAASPGDEAARARQLEAQHAEVEAELALRLGGLAAPGQAAAPAAPGGVPPGVTALPSP
jgi:DNA-binding response OmpR family regulator